MFRRRSRRRRRHSSDSVHIRGTRIQLWNDPPPLRFKRPYVAPLVKKSPKKKPCVGCKAIRNYANNVIRRRFQPLLDPAKHRVKDSKRCKKAKEIRRKRAFQTNKLGSGSEPRRKYRC